MTVIGDHVNRTILLKDSLFPVIGRYIKGPKIVVFIIKEHVNKKTCYTFSGSEKVVTRDKTQVSCFRCASCSIALPIE